MSYLAPEIVAGGRPIPPSDQFACGSVLWESLVGRKLFDGTTDYETYCRLRDCMVQPLRPLRGDVPQPFLQIGTVLKKVQLRKDLHSILSTSVRDARLAMGITPRVDDTSGATPLPVEPEETPRLTILPLESLFKMPNLPTPEEKPKEKPRGLRHYLPFFGRKRG